MEEFFGSSAGLSASVITRLTTDWQRERDQFAHRSLKERDYVWLTRRRPGQRCAELASMTSCPETKTRSASYDRSIDGGTPLSNWTSSQTGRPTLASGSGRPDFGPMRG